MRCPECLSHMSEAKKTEVMPMDGGNGVILVTPYECHCGVKVAYSQAYRAVGEGEHFYRVEG